MKPPFDKRIHDPGFVSAMQRYIESHGFSLLDTPVDQWFDESVQGAFKLLISGEHPQLRQRMALLAWRNLDHLYAIISEYRGSRWKAIKTWKLKKNGLSSLEK